MAVFTDLYNVIDVIDVIVVFDVIDVFVVFVVWPPGPDRGPPEHGGATEEGAEETQGPGSQSADGA